MVKGKRTAVIMQPALFPWMGYFQLMAQADVFIHLDSVQYEKQEWCNRNRLKGSNGNPVWLTIPVRNQPLATPIREVEIADDTRGWRRKHLNTIRSLLGKAPFFSRYWPDCEALYAGEKHLLSKFCLDGIAMVTDWLGLERETMLASSLSVNGKRTELLRQICKAVNATRYLSPVGAASYLEEEKAILERDGVEVAYQTWEHPVYPQRFGDFLSHMSILDVVMNVGGEEAARLLGVG